MYYEIKSRTTLSTRPGLNERFNQRTQELKIDSIIETNEPEKSWNGVRFRNTALNEGHEVKIFLMCTAVEIESIVHEKYNAKKQIDEFVTNKGIVLTWGKCLKSRNKKQSGVCPISSMMDWLSMVEWSERLVTF